MSTKGRMTLPAGIRRRFNIRLGTRVVFVEEKGRLLLHPITRDYIRSFRGMFKLKPGEKSAVQELIKDRVDDRAGEEA